MTNRLESKSPKSKSPKSKSSENNSPDGAPDVGPDGGLDLPSVLFVDDDPDVRFLLEKTLEGTFTVVSAGSPEEALAILGGEDLSGGESVGGEPSGGELGGGKKRLSSRAQAFENGKPDLFLLDIRFPGRRSGTELLHLLQDFGLAESVPAVALTTYAGAEDREALLKEGFDEHVSKPFRREELIGALRGALQGTRQGAQQPTGDGIADGREAG